MSKTRQQAVYDTKPRNVACEKCARWPSYRRCRGGLNLITASNIHLANKSRLETRAREGKARLADAHNGGWQMTVIHEKRPDIYRIYRRRAAPHLSGETGLLIFSPPERLIFTMFTSSTVSGIKQLLLFVESERGFIYPPRWEGLLPRTPLIRLMVNKTRGSWNRS